MARGTGFGSLGWRRLLLPALFVAVTLAPWPLLGAGGPWPGRGPAEWARMDLPRLRVASSEAWRRERSRAVVIRRDSESWLPVELLLGYEPADGGERHRKSWRGVIPWPAGRSMPGGDTEAAYFEGMAFRPALLLLAEAATPWWKADLVLGDDWDDRYPRLYIGARRPDGGLGGVPMFVDAAAEWGVRLLGSTLGPPDFAEPGCLELRITRDGEGIRYRFGHYAAALEGARRFDGGDVRLPAEAALAPGEGPLIPALAALLLERFPTPRGPRETVYLTVGRGVRFVDVLRAVECAGGSPEVIFLDARRLFPREIEALRLPAPRDAADAAPLVEDYGQQTRVILNIALTEDRRGVEIKAKGRPLGPENLPGVLAGRETALVRADFRAPWGSVLPAVRAVRDASLALQFTFIEEEEGYEPERFLAVPPPPEGADVMDVTVNAGADGAWTLAPDPGDPRGRSYRLAALDPTPTAVVLQAALHLLSRGAAGIAF